MNTRTVALIASFSFVALTACSSQTEVDKRTVTVNSTVSETTKAYEADETYIGFFLDEESGEVSAYANNPTSSTMTVKEIAAQSESCKYSATVDASVESGERVFFKLSPVSEFESCVHPDKVGGPNRIIGMSPAPQSAKFSSYRAVGFMMSTIHVVDATTHTLNKVYYTIYSD